MKTWIFLGLFLAGSNTWAYPCPSDLETHPQKQLFHRWLSQIYGQRIMEGCQVEITICNPTEVRTDSALIGEIYIVDHRRREAYLPLNIVESNPKIRTSLKTSRTNLNYVKYDYFFEQEFGNTETYKLNFRLHPKTGNLQSIDLGTYATRKKLNLPNGVQTRWYSCGIR